MSTDESGDERLALETIAAAVRAQVRVFDTAHAYGRDESQLGHNQQMLEARLDRLGEFLEHPNGE
jgi:aryl-alcohol dehydrogenase-like predicted oxidoreductase